ncbi:MAG: ERCC4 domain-containing protein [Acidobacteriota bacterium]
MVILVDSREQAPYTFAPYGAAPATATLPAGDYSLGGFADRVGVERKELDDLVACLIGTNRERFERELQRLSRYELAAVVVEATLEDVRQGRYRSQMNGHAAAQSILAFEVRYRVPFLFCGDRDGAEYVTYSLLAKYAREISERYRALVKAEREAGAAVGMTA